MTHIDTFLIGFLEFIDWSLGYLLLAFILIMADLRFGILAAIKRKEIVRKYSAIRRTLNKIGNYVIWLIIAYVIGKVFVVIPFDIDLPLWILIIIYAIELGSIANNFFMSIGLKRKIDILGYIFKETGILKKDEDKDKDDKDKENERD